MRRRHFQKILGVCLVRFNLMLIGIGGVLVLYLLLVLVLTDRTRLADERMKSTAAGPMIVTTTSLWADLVTAVTCDGLARVKTLMPSATDPHGYQPSLAARAVLEAADLVVMNGLVEEGLEAMIRSVEQGGTAVFRTIDHVETLPFNGDHSHDGVDPHLWMDPVRVSEVLPKLTKRIREAGGLNPSSLQACLDQSQLLLAKLDEEIRVLVADVPAARRKFVTNHASLGYFADRYGFEMIGTVVPSTSTLAAASPAHLEQLGERMKASGVSVILVEAGQASADARALAKHVGGVQVVEVFTGGLLETDPRVMGYVELLRTNARLITEALLGESDNSKHDGHGRSRDG
jgi:zinc/manganese transport system substrate-binding protein